MSGKHAKPSTELTYDQRCERTSEAFADPQSGDRFHEMYTFWVYVVERNGDLLTLLSAAAPCTFPDDGTLQTLTCDEFRAKHAYSTRDKTPLIFGSASMYDVLLADRGNDVTGWADRARALAAVAP